MSDASSIDRREALRRVALLLGGTLSAPAIAGVLAGCSAAGTDAKSDAGTWKPRAFPADQGEMVATIAEHIIPTTDTPGARTAGVHRFIDVMMAEYYPQPVRDRFVAGLADLDARATRAHGRKFLQCDAAAQQALVAALDAETFATPAPQPEAPWFHTMKELTLLGYYTSEIGATKELRYEGVPGRYDGCVSFATIGRTWAV
jgi:hypothetical protein